MRILIFHLGPIAEVIIASSLNKGLMQLYSSPDVEWVVDNQNAKEILSTTENVKHVYLVKDFCLKYFGDSFDILVNLSEPDSRTDIVRAKKKMGFGFNDRSKKYHGVLFGDNKIDMNLFQIYYRLAGMTWHGQGYDLCYRPKMRSKKKRTGLAIANANLRNFIKDNLDLEMSNLWIVPYKKNLFKRMDEINRCRSVITDDWITLNLALYLQKNINFLQTFPTNFNIELFGKGEAFEVPASYAR